MFLLANTMLQVSEMDTEVSFLNIRDFIPGELPREPRIPDSRFPRLVTTHREYLGQPARSIYLLRHPADVMVSYYHYLSGRWNRDLGSFSSFIRDPRFGIPAWIKHVESWEGRRDILVRFEDLKQNALAQLRRIVDVCDRDIDLKILEAAVEKSSFENMKKIEEKKGLPYKEGANPDYTFMRKGEYNRGKSFFREKDYIYLDKTASHLLERYGYEEDEVGLNE